MDLLIDLIIMLIKQATKPRQPTVVPTPQMERQRQAALAQQVQTMQRTMAAQQARTRAKPPGAPRAAAVRSAPPVVQRNLSAIGDDLPAPRRASAAATRIPGLKIPFLLGEVLAKPVALQDEEM